MNTKKYYTTLPALFLGLCTLTPAALNSMSYEEILKIPSDEMIGMLSQIKAGKRKRTQLIATNENSNENIKTKRTEPYQSPPYYLSSLDEDFEAIQMQNPPLSLPSSFSSQDEAPEQLPTNNESSISSNVPSIDDYFKPPLTKTPPTPICYLRNYERYVLCQVCPPPCSIKANSWQRHTESQIHLYSLEIFSRKSAYYAKKTT